jgi:hypothetical protein
MMLCEKRNVCPVCFNERELDEELVQNAELQGATPRWSSRATRQ